MKNLIFSMLIFSAAVPAFPNGEPETFDEMLSSLTSGSVEQIETNRLEEMIKSGRPLYIIDSRTAGEYKVSRLRGSVFADYETFNPESLGDIPKSATLVVYCSVGYRSEKTGEKLLSAGYTEVYNLRGGIFKWINENREIYGPDGETKRIHGYSPDWSKWLTNGEITY